MTDSQKQDIERLRKLGYGYKAIAHQLGVPVNTIKTHCRRHDIEKAPEKIPYVHCLNCGKRLIQTPGRKQKKFCTDRCRSLWWAEQPDELRYKTRYKHTCEMCGAEFESHTQNQRFCSHKCAAAMRRGEVPVYEPAEESQHATEAGCRADQAQPEKTSAERAIQGAGQNGAGFPGLPPHCKCSECTWFVDGKKHCESLTNSAKEIPTTDCKPDF